MHSIWTSTSAIRPRHGSGAATKTPTGCCGNISPKGTDLSGYHPDYLAFVAAELNARPRKTLGWKTPAEAFGELLSNPPIVATTA
jgi:hypothetical protein